MNRSATLGELRGLLDIASDDELAAFAVIARKVMGRGREQYGATNLATDVRDFVKEAADEFVDAAWYLALDIVQRTAHKFAPPSESINEFASAGGGATTFERRRPPRCTEDEPCPACERNDGSLCWMSSVCTDCGESQHKPDCPWRVIVPGKGE